MSCQRPKEWISAVLSRLDKFLELSVTQGSCLSAHLEHLKQCLINISQSKCPAVINGLANSLKKLSIIRIYGEQQEYNLYTCQLVVMELLERCLSKDSVLPDDVIMTKQLLPEICQFLHRPANDKPAVGSLQSSASRVFYQISENNFNIVFCRISNRLKELTASGEEFIDYGDFDLIQHLHLDLERITILLKDIVQHFNNLRRPLQVAFLTSLDKALWKWVSTSATTQLNQLHKDWEAKKNQSDYQELTSSAEKLFDAIESISDGSKKKSSYYWPLQILLISFCPGVMTTISTHTEATKNNKADFLLQLQKNLQNCNSRSIHDSCVESLVRLLKVSTYVSNKQDPKLPIHSVVDSYLTELQKDIFERPVLRTCEQLTAIECFVSSFRLRPDQDYLVPKYSSPATSLYHKFIFIQSLHCICSQPRMSWWPKVSRLYSFSSNLRKIFTECAIKGSHSNQSPRSTQQSLREKMEKVNASLKRSQDEIQPGYKDLLQLTVRLITADPAIFLQNLTISKRAAFNEFISLLTGLCVLKTSVGSVNLQISCDAFDALLHLHDPHLNVIWFPDQLYFVFWNTSTSIIEKICDYFSPHETLSPEVVRHALLWLQQVIICRIEFIAQNQENPLLHKEVELIQRTWRKLETTLMSLLHSTDTEIVIATLNCFHNLNEEVELRWSFDEFALGRTFPDVHELYRNLGNLIHTKSNEKIIHQISSVFRKIYKYSEAAFQTWELVRQKWDIKTNLLIGCRSQDEPLTTATNNLGEMRTSKKTFHSAKDLEDWENITEFLCSLGAACISNVKPEPPTLINWARKLSSTSSSANIQDTNEPNVETIKVDKTSQSYINLSNFLKTLLQNLHISSNKTSIDISSKIRILLNKSIHPILYPTFFEQLTSYLTSNLFDSDDHILMNNMNDCFIQNIIIILQNIFEDAPTRDGIYFGEESIESMITHIVRYVRHMETVEETLRTRILFCKMIFQMMKRKNDFFYLSEIKFRNKLIEHLTDWLMTSSLSVTNSNHSQMTTVKLLDEYVMQAIGLLLLHLPLHPHEGDGGDVPEAKSLLFKKYFTLFMKLLPKLEEDLGGSQIEDHVIIAMCNLLSANIENGMSHVMSLAYQRDDRMKAAFLQILTKILQQNCSSCFNTLSDSISTERFQRLVELVTMLGDNGELPIANALANVVHTNYLDELARVFVILFDAKHLLYHLLWNMFSKEVEDAGSVQTIFRGSSLASKIITFCFKVYGASYLHNLVEPLVAWSLKPEVSKLNFEVDERRLSAGYDIQKSRNNLQRLTDRFFTRIMTSNDKFPPQLKNVCHCLYQVVSQRFPDSGTGALAGAIFLRFLNPAIATPYANGLCDRELEPELLRAYRLMCKIMQNIANHVLFTKEEHMKYFNDFVTARFDICQQFFVQISTSEYAGGEVVIHNTMLIKDTNVTALHRLLWNEQEKIGNFLAKSRDAKAVGRRPYDKMVTLLAYLGPPEYTRPVLSNSFTGSNPIKCNFEDVMTKRKTEESEEYKMVKSLNIFYQFGRSKMGYPVFYYIARRYKVSEIHEDILAYYMMLALKPYSNRKFDLVVDLTHTCQKNSFRSEQLSRWQNFFPPNIYSNLDAIYIYNPSSWVLDFIETNSSCFQFMKGRKNIRFVDRLESLQKFIFPEHQKIPAATRELDEDVITYSSALRFSDHLRLHIKVGFKSFQLEFAEKRNMLSFEITINDVFYASDIESIRIRDDENSFQLKVAPINDPMIFSHVDSLKIVNSLSHMKNRWELYNPNHHLFSSHHKISSKDVPGALLNVALLNLGCSNALVRSGSYNLLCSLSSSFQLHLESSLYESDGLCIPSNNTLFIVTISNLLARKESHLTLEFLTECIAGFRCCIDKQKSLCLEYMEPWLFNLPTFLTESFKQHHKVKAVIEQLIDMTVHEKYFYPSVQTKIWGNLGKMPSLVDMILESFISVSTRSESSAEKAEVMADVSVALAANNMQLVSSQIIKRLSLIIDKTSLRPTPTLDKHKHWDEITVFARCLLMLSFNNNLDVAYHLPNLFHLISLLLSTGSTSLRASIHGLVINIIHSLLTCEQLHFNKETREILGLSLSKFCLPKFYRFFGIADVQSAASTAFQCDEKKLLNRQLVEMKMNEEKKDLDLRYLDLVVDAFLEVIEACIKDSSHCSSWIDQWVDLCGRFAYQYNPSLQPRALVVLGCISKSIDLIDIKRILTIMQRSLECRPDPGLFQATLISLNRLQSILQADPAVYCVFFWCGVCAMQLNDKQVYMAGFSLIQGSLHHLNDLNSFQNQSPSECLMKVRSLVEEPFQEIDRLLDVSFQSHFHFAFCTYLIKGFRLNDSEFSARIICLIDFMLDLISKFNNSNKYKVTSDSISYLTVLLPVNEEVQRFCHPRKTSTSAPAAASSSNSSTISRLSNGHVTRLSSTSLKSTSTEAVMTSSIKIASDDVTNKPEASRTLNLKKSCRIKKGPLDVDSDSSSSSRTNSTSSFTNNKLSEEPIANSLFFNEDILDKKLQALLLTLLATQVKYSRNFSDVKILYEYLAEASLIFPDMFPIVHGLLDHKVNNVLQHCEDPIVSKHVQFIVHNSLQTSSQKSSDETISYLKGLKFSGIWKFAGPFNKNSSIENVSYVTKIVGFYLNHYFEEIGEESSLHKQESTLDGAEASESKDQKSKNFRNRGPKLTIKLPPNQTI